MQKTWIIVPLSFTAGAVLSSLFGAMPISSASPRASTSTKGGCLASGTGVQAGKVAPDGSVVNLSVFAKEDRTPLLSCAATAQIDHIGRTELELTTWRGETILEQSNPVLVIPAGPAYNLLETHTGGDWKAVADEDDLRLEFVSK